jgi:nucleotide-binding universal stress UspA family protein
MLGTQKPPYQLAVKDFQRARTRAALQDIVSRLAGRTVALWSYEEIVDMLHHLGQSERGVQQIPLDRIVGSVDRYQDFTRIFLPRLGGDQMRPASVWGAAPSVSEPPPISVYQLGEAFYIADGNHRVSIARRQGAHYIDATVTEVRTREALSATDSPDDIICKAEYAAFLENTELLRLKPGADLRVSVPGQIAHLENLIEVHRYFIEASEEIELSDAEAVCHWYEESYQPLVGAIREQGIMRYLPGRTEADFYVWLARHQTLLQNELGWDIRPEVAVSQLGKRLEQRRPERGLKRIYRRLLDAVSAEDADEWSQQRAMARYSDHLFGDILVPVVGNEEGSWALYQAQVIAAREQAQICGLLVWPGDDRPADFEGRRAAFDALCAESAVDGTLGWVGGDAVTVVLEQSLLTDLIVIDRTFGLRAAAPRRPSAELLEILGAARRPVLVVPRSVSPLSHVLLVYDGGAKAEEALFVAAYLGERWGTRVTVYTPFRLARGEEAKIERASRYLALHEIEASFVSGEGDLVETLLQIAGKNECDLIVTGVPQARLLGRGTQLDVEALLVRWQLPLLICT